MSRRLSSYILTTIIFACLAVSFSLFFKSELMSRFIWNMNTFQGRFVNLPETLPKDTLVGAYGYSIRDFNLHSQRTVSENAFVYASILAFLVSTHIFFLLNPSQFKSIRNMFSLCGIFILGFGARLFFAYHTTCNNDLALMYSYEEIIRGAGNIYQLTDYNYSPLWFLIAKVCFFLADKVPQFYFMFAVRFLLSLFDVATCFLLMDLARSVKADPVRTAALFFLNPISIIITGYHGQIDNVSIFFLLLGIWAALKSGKVYWGWLLVSVGVVVKHQIIQQPLVYLNQFMVSKRKILVFFALTVFLFLISFGFYWQGGASQIIKNVFGYGGMSRPYGLVTFHGYPIVTIIHKYLFISLLLIWPFIYKTNHVLKSALISMLFTLTWTSGISTQTFVLPIALGALMPSGGFVLFTIAASLFLFGNLDELKLNVFQWITWNYVWFCAFIWFLIELNTNRLASIKTTANSKNLLHSL